MMGSITRRIGAFSLAAWLVLLAVALVAWWQEAALSGVTEEFITRTHQASVDALTLQIRILEGDRIVRHALFELGDVQRAPDIEALGLLDGKIAQGLTDLAQVFPGDPGLPARARGLYESYLGYRGRVLALAGAGHPQEAWTLNLETTQGNPLSALETVLDAISSQAATVATVAKGEVKDLDARSGGLTLGVGILALAILGLGSWWTGRSIARPLDRLRHSVATLASGDTGAPIADLDRRSEVGDIARSLAVLQATYRGAEDQSWVKTSVAGLASQLHQAGDFGQLGSGFLGHLGPLVGAGAAILYVADPEGMGLVPAGTWGVADALGVQGFSRGEGIPGRVFDDGVEAWIDLPQGGAVSLVAGLGSWAPAVLAVLPLKLPTKVNGVLELGFPGPVAGRIKSLLSDLGTEVALAVEILGRAEATRRQAALMEAQAARLEEQSAEQEALIENAPMGILFADTGKVVRGNAALARMFGYASPEDMVGMETGPLIGDEARNAWFVKEIYPRTARGEVIRLELDLHRADGSVFWSRVVAKALKVEGRSRSSLVMFDDITESKKAERLVKDVTDNVPLALFQLVWTADGTNHFTFLSSRAQELLGLAPGRTPGTLRELLETLDPSEARSFEESLGAAVRNQGTWSQDAQVLLPDGKVRWVHGEAVVREGTYGEKILNGSLADVTERRLAQDAMKAAKDLAEDATRMKSDFLANMSHEIRTPMNAIMGMSHLALKTELTPRQRDYMVKIQQSSQHLLGIINDILDFSKIESGKLQVERTEFELEQVLDSVASLLGEKAAAKGLELLFDVAPDVPPFLVGDPLRLGQILINYGSNAVKFTEKGEIGVIVRVRHTDEDGILLAFSVRDTGIGLTEEQKGRLFQSFSQADTSTTRKYGGTGLGLAISKSLAELMGGEVGVDSVPGEGSTFWFTAALGHSKRPRRSLIPQPDLRGRRVLVVDDHETSRQVLTDMLNSMTFVAREARSGHEAIDLLRSAASAGEPFEVVYLDWHMPDLDGFETAKRIRSLGLQPSPHLIMVTAYGREEFFRYAAAARIEDVLVKPVNNSILFDTTLRALGVATEGERTSGRDPSDDEARLATLRGARILLVEDNELNQEVGRELLKDAGFVVEVAENGRIAVDRVRDEGPWDLVLMDMQMPEMDGLDATRAIRLLPDRAQLPIVAMTANAMQADRERCLEAGMNDHLGKPIEPAELWAALLKWIPPRSYEPLEPVGESAPLPAPRPEIPSIPGLDTEAGLRRVLHKTALYLSLLRKFAQGQGNFASRFQAAWDAGDQATAEREAHTLKGLAGNIGAPGLQTLAGQLEAAVKGHAAAPEVRAALEAVEGPLASLVQALVEALPPESTPTALDSAGLAKACGRLAGLLAEDDSEAVDVWDSNLGLWAGLGEAVGPLGTAVKNYAFDEALTLLRQACLDHSIPWEVSR